MSIQKKTEKRNQHYLPKFYLGNFSCNSDRKQIGLFNTRNGIFVPNATLKTECRKKFYYGEDGFIEDQFSILEGEFDKLIKHIINTCELPKKGSEEYFNLLTFISSTDLRNPVKVNSLKNFIPELKKHILELNPDESFEKYGQELQHEEIIQIALSNLPRVVNSIEDLEYKLLVNETTTPFITSDFPIIKYNQLAENENWPYTYSGYQAVGLQLFIPIDPQKILILYDSDIYKLGNRKQKVVKIQEAREVNQINTLQVINCIETIYFNHMVSISYIDSLVEASKKFIRANDTIVDQCDVDMKYENISFSKDDLLITGSTNCKIKLKIKGLKIHNKGKNYKASNMMFQKRRNYEGQDIIV